MIVGAKDVSRTWEGLFFAGRERDAVNAKIGYVAPMI